MIRLLAGFACSVLLLGSLGNAAEPAAAAGSSAYHPPGQYADQKGDFRSPLLFDDATICGYPLRASFF
jgi:hypothetical protein